MLLDKFMTTRDHFSSGASSMAVGLGILVSHVQGYKDNSNTVLESAALRLRLRLNQQSMNPPTPHHQSCYLKSFCLCRKMGDQGFCSVECRNHQIILDDMKELELTTMKMVAAYRRCSGMSETSVLLDDLRQRNKQIPTQKARAIFS